MTEIIISQAASECSLFARKLAEGFYMHDALSKVAVNPNVSQLFPPVLPGQIVPIGSVRKKYGPDSSYYFSYYLDKARTDPDLVSMLERVWLAGALLALGDALNVHHYFDHAPELELIYHLRNAVAHGNRFNINKDGRRRLSKYPANNSEAHVREVGCPTFEVVESLNGTEALFEFMGPADVICLLMSVDVYLYQMSIGADLRPNRTFYAEKEAALRNDIKDLKLGA